MLENQDSNNGAGGREMLELVEANLENSSVKSTHFPGCIEILEELS